MKSKDSGLLRLIAVFKFFKAATLIATGIGAFRLMHADVGTVLEHWATMLSLDPGGHFLSHAIERATNLSPHRIRELGIVSFIYAGLFLTEGTGLWMMKRWAEWFTAIITSSLIPVEVYELVHKPTAIKGLLLLVNVGVVVYLIYRIVREKRTGK
jgi:uncharacterized membrane protein (DUF2068 family)